VAKEKLERSGGIAQLGDDAWSDLQAVWRRTAVAGRRGRRVRTVERAAVRSSSSSSRYGNYQRSFRPRGRVPLFSQRRASSTVRRRTVTRRDGRGADFSTRAAACAIAAAVDVFAALAQQRAVGGVESAGGAQAVVLSPGGRSEGAACDVRFVWWVSRVSHLCGAHCPRSALPSIAAH
jgi:hypothetical protein